MRFLLLVFAILVVSPIAAIAQTPTAEPERLTFLFPESDEIPGSWRELGIAEGSVPAEFTDQSTALYVNDDGGRIVVLLLRHDNSRVAAAAAWETVSGWVESAAELQMADPILDETDPPDNVFDFVRYAGWERLTGFAVSVGGYSFGTNLMAYIVAPVVLEEDAELSGADTVMELIVEKHGGFLGTLLN